MDVRRLRMLLELSRLGSMHEVADELGTTTSTVSQGIAALARDIGAALVEPQGRRVRLTPAGARLAEHAVTILAAVDTARMDLDPDGEPTGIVRVAGFATAIRRTLLPAISRLARTHPGVHVRIHEHEPLEAFDLLARDRVDLALTYDYNLAPATWRIDHEASELWRTSWGLGVPATETRQGLRAHAERPWIVNSRNTADEDVVRTLASLADFTPNIAHRVDSLDLVDELIAAGHGIALLPQDRPTHPDVAVLPLNGPAVELRAYTVTQPGRSRWPPIRAVIDQLSQENDRPR